MPATTTPCPERIPNRTVDDALRSIEALAEILGAAGVTMTP